MEAARAAGMQVIAVPDPALGRERVAAADVVLDSLVGLRPADLGLRGACLVPRPRGIALRTMPVPEDVELSFPADGGCFGCSPSNPAGLQLRFRRRGERDRRRAARSPTGSTAPRASRTAASSRPSSTRSPAPRWTSLTDRRVMTGELTVRYERPCPVEAPLEIVAAISDRAHPRYWVVEAEIHHEGVRLARSSGKFFLRDAAPVAP